MAPAKFAIIAMIPMIEAVSHDKLILAVVPKSKVIIALIPRQEMQQTQTFGICQSKIRILGTSIFSQFFIRLYSMLTCRQFTKMKYNIYIGRLYLSVGLETNKRNKCYDKNVLFHQLFAQFQVVLLILEQENIAHKIRLYYLTFNTKNNSMNKKTKV